MVSLGKMREEFKETMTSPAPQKSKPPLHNFTMPWLQWGNKKLMRCVKVNDSNGQVPTPTSFDHRRPSERVSIGRFRDSEIQRPGSTDPIRDESLKLMPRDDGIEAVREKLMVDLQTAADKMKSAFLRDGLPAQSETPVTAKDSSDALRPWNLRTRRAACKEPRMSSAGGNQQPNWSPVRTDTVKSSSRFLPGNAVATANVIGELTSGEKRDRAKFSVALTRGDIADDFMAMSGHRLPRRPKKRPKYVQKQLDTLFPGLWLDEINADLYKVPDATETGKR